MIPETNNRKDWPRLVKLALEKQDRRGQALEANTLSRAALAFLS
jgi:hypothetical protein